MARSKNKINGRFLFLEYSLLKSDEWKRLSSKAIQVYILMRMKFCGDNENEITLSYREVEGAMSSATYRKCLKELICGEIISVVQRGGLPNFRTIYSIKNRWWGLRKKR